MNIEELTIKQARELAAMFPQQTTAQSATAHPFIGQTVVARCYAAGVHVGEVISVDGENVVLSNSLRLWSWKAKDGVALSGVAQNGVDRAKCKIDTNNPLIYLTGVCELIPMTQVAKESVYGR